MKKYIIEFIGTLLLILIGCGTSVIIGTYTPSEIILTSLSFGLTLTVITYVFSDIADCNFNPAISLGMVINKKIKIKEFIIYTILQIIGAIIGILILGLLLNSFKQLGSTTYNEYLPNNSQITWISALIIEITMTFIFVIVTLKSNTKEVNSSIIRGLTLTMISLFSTTFTKASINPARSIAPAIIEKGPALQQLWLFIIAPIIGSILASLFYKYIIKEKNSQLM